MSAERALAVQPGSSLTGSLSTQVLVVGSGPGGATTAAELAAAGFDVVVVEEGDLVVQGELAPFSLEQMERQYRAGGVTVALGRPSIAYTEGRGVGGGSEVNSGLYRRPPGELLERWATQYGIDALDPVDVHQISDEVEAALEVQPVPGAVTPASERLRRGADRLGWQHDESPRWMRYPPGGSAETGRRRSMSETYLPVAVHHGARIVSGVRADRLTFSGDRVTGVAASVAGGEGGRRREVTIRAEHVFVCGGAIQSPAFLQRSGLRGRIGLGLAVHPTVKLAVRFGDEINVPDDVPVHQVKEFAPAISFGGSASRPGLVALSLLDDWARFGPQIGHWRSMAVYYAAIQSEGRGRVRTLPGLFDPLVTYRLTRRDRVTLGRGLSRLALLLLEAGADEVYPSYRGAPVVRDRSDLRLMQASFSATRASVMTVHLCSTVPMGGDPQRSATDSFGRVRGVDNLYVNDAALLPDAPGVNPQASVMAIAIRNARHFAARTKPSRARPPA